jgi:hypothetical protein
MHFIDRQNCPEIPTVKLMEFNAKDKGSWATYNLARINNIKPLPVKPPSSWLHDTIRKPLKKLFLKNCGYCGIHTDNGRDAEVDHFHPTSKDPSADYVFEWTNYVWSCPSCNGLKGNNFPFLNPCSLEEMKHLYFNQSDGTYLLFHNTPLEIEEKYILTNKNSNLNSKNRPDRRKCLFRDVNRQLIEIRLAFIMFDIESKIFGKSSNESLKKFQLLNAKKKDFLDLIKSGDYLFLIEYIILEFNKKNTFFPYTFKELLEESKFMEN